MEKQASGARLQEGSSGFLGLQGWCWSLLLRTATTIQEPFAVGTGQVFRAIRRPYLVVCGAVEPHSVGGRTSREEPVALP